MKLSDIFQKTISFGYLFLVLMGILKESLFYYQINVNILKYSSLMDVLLSPIADLTSQPLILFGLIFYILAVLLLQPLLSKNRSKKWIRKRIGLNADGSEKSEEEIKTEITSILFKMLALGILCFFVGVGMGSGVKLKERIESGQLTYNQKITFGTGDSENIHLINTNSAYYFYLTKGSKTIKISPIGAVKQLELAPKK